MDLLAGVLSAIPGVSSIAGAIGNYFSQKENLDYQKELQQESWERDDTAVQRRMKDLEAAGINPLMAAGSAAGNSPVVHTEAPQLDTGVISKGSDQIMQGLSMTKDFAVKDAQAQLLQAQRDSVVADTEYKRAITPGAADLQTSQTELNRMSTTINQANNMFKLAELTALKSDMTRYLDIGYKSLQTDEQRTTYDNTVARYRASAAQSLAEAGVNKELADVVALGYANEIAKNEAEISGATVPSRIAGSYTDVVGKAIGAGGNAVSLASYLDSFIQRMKVRAGK